MKVAVWNEPYNFMVRIFDCDDAKFKKGKCIHHQDCADEARLLSSTPHYCKPITVGNERGAEK